MDSINLITAEKILDLKTSLPEIILEKHFLLNPQMLKRYTSRHIKFYKEDTEYNLSYLSESIKHGEPILFTEYLLWAKSFFSSLNIDLGEIEEHFEIQKETLASFLEEGSAKLTNEYLEKGLSIFRGNTELPGTFISDSNPLKEVANKYLSYLIDGNKNDAYKLIMDCVSNGIPIKEIYLDVFQVTQKETGRLWQLGKIIVAQEHFITAATQLIMSQLYSLMFSETPKDKRIVVSCINGELHEMGVRMVADLFEMSGWDTYYFGANTPKNSLIKSIEIYKPQVIAISATMTYNLSSVGELIKEIKENPKTSFVKIIVGGYPFSIAENLWRKLGADGFAFDTDSAIELANSYFKMGE